MKLECVNDLNTESMTAKADVFIADLLCDLISSNFFKKLSQFYCQNTIMCLHCTLCKEKKDSTD